MKKMGSDRVCSGRRRFESLAIFPFGKFCGIITLLVIGGMFVFRLSETGGPSSKMACFSAMGLSFLSASLGLYPVYKVWGKDILWTLLGVFLSNLIRLLIGFIGVVIIFSFTRLQRIQFVFFLALFYTVFLIVDTWLALWVLQNAESIEANDREVAVHGNMWDIVSRDRKSA